MIPSLLNGIFFLMIVTSFTLSDVPGFSAMSLGLTVLFIGGTMLVDRKIVIYKELVLPGLFMGFALLSIIWGGNAEEALKISSAVLFGMAVFLGLKKGGRLPVLVGALVVCAVVNMALSANITNFDGDESERVEGLFGNANEVAVFLSLSAFVVYFLSARRVLWVKVLVFGLLAFVFIFTGSRQGLFLVVFIAGCIFADFCWGLKGRLALLRLPILLAVMLLGGWGVHMAEKYADDVIVLKRLENFLQGTEKGSARTRQYMVERALQMWNAKPLNGYGAGGFAGNAYFATYAHNTFVELLADLGLIGFALYYGTFVYILLKAWAWRSRYTPQVAMRLILMLLVLGSWSVLFRSKSGWLFVAVAAYCVSSRGLPPDEIQRRAA